MDLCFFVLVLRACSPLPSALRRTGLFGFPKQTVCSACWGGGVGAKVGRFPLLKVQKKRETALSEFRAFQNPISNTTLWKFQCDVVVCEVVQFLVESSVSFRCPSMPFRWVV